MTTVKAPLVGMHFRPPAKAILAVLPSACPLSVVPEPDNPHDENALAVFVKSAGIPEHSHSDLDREAQFFGSSVQEILARDAWQLGYIARQDAMHLAPRITSAMGDNDHFEGRLAFALDGKPTVQLELP